MHYTKKQSVEHYSDKKSVLSRIEETDSAEFLIHRHHYLRERISSDSPDVALYRAGRLLQRRNKLYETVDQSKTYDQRQAVWKKAEHIGHLAVSTYGQGIVDEYGATQDAIYQIEQHQTVTLLPHEVPGMMYDLLARIQSSTFDTSSDANITYNSTDNSTDDYVDYLLTKEFIKHIPVNETKPRLLAVLDREYDIPLRCIVGADGFDSWAGRGYRGNGDKAAYSNGRHTITQSITQIINYATMNSSIPPVKSAYCYIGKDKRIRIIVAGSNHRTAAAIARGDTTIGFAKNASLRVLWSRD